MTVRNLLKENETLRELLSGILCYGILWQVLLAVFTERRLYHAGGLWIGIFTAMALAVHMAYALDTALSFDEKGAAGHLQKKSVFRYVLVCVLIAAAGITDFVNPLTVFAGVMGLKAGAYLQPVTHKLLNRNTKSDDKGGE